MDDGGDYAIVANEQVIAEAICKTAASTFQPAEANARLIAAAPDLLAALERIETWLTNQPLDQLSKHEMLCETRIAINKAEPSP